MVSCTEYNINTNCATYYCDTVAELSNLPSLTSEGKAEVAGMHKINAGSMAMLPDGTVYVLTGDNAATGGTWKVFG